MSVIPNLAPLTTTITNMLPRAQTFSWIPPHGRVLAAGASYTVAGDITDYFKADRPQEYKAYLYALNNGWVTINTTNPVQVEYFTALNTSVIAVGDLVWLHSPGVSQDVQSANVFPWTSNLLATQEAFGAVFVGVALAANSGSASSNNTQFPVDVSPETVWTFPAVSGQYYPGETLAPAEVGATNFINAQQLTSAVAAASIARVVGPLTSTSATSVQVRFQSAYRGFNNTGLQI